MPVLFYGEQKKETVTRREREMKKQYWAGFAALVLVLTVCTVLFARAGKNKEDNETL